MASSGGGKKTKRQFLDRFKLKGFRSSSTRETDTNEVAESAPSSANQEYIIKASGTGTPSLSDTPDVQDHGLISPSATRRNASVESLGTITSSATRSNVRDGFGIASRFIQMLLKKLPDCVDGNPVKAAFSIVKAIIEIKDDIGDNKDALRDGLQSTMLLLSDAIGKVELHDSDEVKREIEDYKRKIEEQYMRLIEITQELEFKIRNIDYENYKRKISTVCRVISETTNMFMLSMQIEIRKTTALMPDQIKVDALPVLTRRELTNKQKEEKAQLARSLQDLNPSKKADHGTVLEGQTLKRELCTEGTRVRILEEITHWANDPATNSPRVFWLTGQAGSGKTTIAYTLAKKFEKDQPTVLDSNFLCSRQFDETRSVNRIFPTISYQLAHKCVPYEEALHAQVTDKSSIVDHNVSEQIQELLVGPWQKASWSNDIPPYLIVIDALDELVGECGSKFPNVLLTTINQRNFVGLKFLVTSRTDPQIVHLCDTFDSKYVCRLQDVPIEDAEADIERYLDVKLPNMIGSPELAELRNRSSGLFVYAATAVRILTTARSITHKEQIWKLNNLLSQPSRLSSAGKDKSPTDELYEQILYEAFSDFVAEEDLAPRLRILFTFLCAAERIATSVAAALMDEDEELAKSVLNDLHAVLYVQDGRVFWYHASFPDFLFDETRSNFRIGEGRFNFWCDEDRHHSFLALSCLHIMNSEDHGLRFNMGKIPSSFLLDSDHVNELREQVNENITPALRYSSFTGRAIFLSHRWSPFQTTFVAASQIFSAFVSYSG